MADQQQCAVDQHGQPEAGLKGGLARLVTKEPLSRQCPRPTAAEGKEVQGALTDTLVSAPGREFIESIGYKGDDAEEGVDDDDQMKTS